MAWSSENIKNFFESIFIQPWVAAVTTLVGVTAGALGSIFSTELKASFPFEETIIQPDKIFLFWGSLLIFGIFFGSVQWAHLRRSAKAHRELTHSTSTITEGTENIRSIVKELLTLPPSGFLDQFRANLEDSIYITTLAINKDQLTKSDAALTIRTVLDGIVSLAMLFHENHKETIPSRYAANIMLFKTVKNLSSEKDVVTRRLMFWEDKLDITKYYGVLDLLEELSTSTDSREPLPDDEIGPFALAVPAIPFDKRNDQKYLLTTDLIPGAPWTFITKKISLFVDSENLLTVARAGNFTPYTIQMIENYMKSPKGQKVQSFISIPIPSPDFIPDHDMIGVLNIHRNTDGLFKGNGVELFSPFMLPFSSVLSKLLERYKDLPDR